MTSPAKASESDIGFVLVHGAGFDVWVWDDVLSLIETPTLAARFPGRDDDQSVPDELRLSDYTDAVIEQIDQWETSRVILVAHSIGGAVCMEVASRIADRVVGFIGVSAVIPEPGESFLSCFPLHQRLIQQALIRFAGTQPPEGIIRDSLCNALTDEQADRVVAEYIPESRYLFTDSVNGNIPAVTRRYIQTSQDQSIKPKLQGKMATSLGTDDIVTLETGHLPMLSRPGELASTLEEFSNQLR